MGSIHPRRVASHICHQLPPVFPEHAPALLPPRFHSYFSYVGGADRPVKVCWNHLVFLCFIFRDRYNLPLPGGWGGGAAVQKKEIIKLSLRLFVSLSSFVYITLFNLS